jgi:hypothetical protein
MNTFLFNVLQWAEVWAIFIPLPIILRYKIKSKEMRPVILYVLVAIFLNTASQILTELYKAKLLVSMPRFLQDNLTIYNLNTFIRVILLGWFIINTRLLKPNRIFKYILLIYIVLVVYNFISRQKPYDLSAILYVTESVLLLAFCVSFFLYSIKDESDIIWMEQTEFIICSGISLYEALNFFSFLFYDAIKEKNEAFGYMTMKIFSITYVILCILIAVALYRNKEQSTKLNSVTS